MHVAQSSICSVGVLLMVMICAMCWLSGDAIGKPVYYWRRVLWINRVRIEVYPVHKGVSKDIISPLGCNNPVCGLK